MSSSEPLAPRRLRWLLALALTACGQGGPGAAHDPRPARLEPGWGETRASVPVVLHGENFVRLVAQRVDRAPALETREDYQLFLDDTPLAEVRWVDAGQLAAVVPAGLPSGWHALRVVSPLGREVRLERAYYGSPTPAARLEASAAAAPETLAVGQESRLTLTVRNTGGTPALGVTPAVVSTDGPPAQLTALTPPRDLAPGASADFQWRAVTTAAGRTALRLSLSAREEGSDRPLDVETAATLSLTALAPARLVASSGASPTQVSVGQELRVRLTASNEGQADARAVTPGLALSDPLLVEVRQAPAPGDVGPGNARTFEWQLVARGPGTLRLTASATGTDALTQAPVSATTPELAVVVQLAPVLEGTLVAPATVSTGQPFALALTVHNAGEATALGVLPDAPVSTGAGAFDVLASPAAQDVPGGTTRTFTWSCRARDPGDLSVEALARGTDANSGTEVTSAPARAAMQIQAAAALAVAATAPPERVSVGHAFALDVAVHNAGDAAALRVRPSLGDLTRLGLEALSEPMPQDVAGRASATFSWTLVARTEGTPALELSAAGTDANSAVTAASTPVPLAVTAERPAALAASVRTSTERLSLGQELEVSLDVANTGAAAALGVTAAAPVPSGTGELALLLAPAAQDVPGGQTRTFTWRYRAEAAGAPTLALRVDGRDGNSGQPVSVTAGTPPLVLQRPAALSAAASAERARVSTGQTQTLTLTVQNTGEALARAVTPAAPLLGGTATAQVLSSPAAQDLPGGEARTFQWVVLAERAGSLQATLSAQGRDGNSDAAVGAEATLSIEVQQAALLTASAQASPARVSVGQDVTLALLVSNAGEASATSVVLPAPVASGTATLGLLASPVAADVAGQSSRPFTWTLRAEAPGTVTLGARATAQDANSGAALDTGLASAAEVVVELPAQLRLEVEPRQASVNEGGPLLVDVTVFNDGQASARGVTASVAPSPATGADASAPAPPAADIPGGASHTFTFAFVAGSAGTLHFEASAAGADGNSALPLQAGPVTSSAVTVLRAGELSAALTATPAQVTVGQPVTLTLTVSNAGQSAALGVAPSGLTLYGTATAVPAPTPAAQDIPGGESRTFAWVLDTTGAGSLGASLGASGTDATDGLRVDAPSATASEVQVQAPPSLSATLQVPSDMGVNTDFTVQLTVRNTGGATAIEVTPDALTPSGEAPPGYVSGPSPASATLTGGTTVAFTWTYRAAREGAFTLEGGADGKDANTGAPVRARTVTATGGTTAAQPLAQAALESALGTDSRFAFVFGFGGRVYVGPSRDGTRAARFAPDGSNLETVSLAFARDTVGNTPGNKQATFTTLGTPGCTADTAACGPDNEDGYGLFFSGTWGNEEWLGMAGGSAKGELDYLYFTRDTDPALDLSFMDVSGILGGNTHAPAAAHFHNGDLYVGYSDSGGSRPYLTRHRTRPVAPGLDAVKGVDVDDMKGDKLPALGNGATPKNSADVTAVEAMASFGGKLYVANNGGCARSTSVTPSIADVTNSWVDCTPWSPTGPTGPASAAWAAHASVLLDPNANGVNLTPRQKATPAMAVFRNRLYLARNTTAGPQLFACAPAALGSSTDCAPADWTLVAPNTAGTTTLTQFNAPANARVTLLVATARYLYVGFDNDGGLNLYRTAATGVPTLADFTGRSGCTAPDSTCVGLGGQGLGAGVTQLYSAVALTFGGRDYVYLSAGTGSGPVRVYRLVE